MKRFLKESALATGLLVLGLATLYASDNLRVYSNGSVVFSESSDNIGYVGIGADKSSATIYDKNGNELISAPLSMIDSVTFENGSVERPIADVLDVQFNADGTATDLSPMHNVIEDHQSGALMTYYNDTYGRYVAKFSNTWAGATSGYYKIDYANNEAFKNALADGHTLEAVVMADYDGEIGNGEAKFFASHERGGTGLMVCKTANGMNGGNDLIFLPNVSESGSSSWKWAVSGVVPQPQVYYHIVGVWNKEEGKADVYINGELKNSVDAVGDLVWPTENSRWFSIGSDSGPSAQLGWSGDVVIARIYDKPLNAAEVDLLWREIKETTDGPTADILDVQFNEDGTATDVSPMHNAVETHSSAALTTYYSNTYERYVAKFNNTWAGSTSGYYKIDYSTNQEFKDALADGHTLEAVVMADYNPPIKDGEAKFFSSHETGGTGLYVCKAAKGLNGKNELCFLPHVGGAWRHASSGIVPEPGKYYHVVGVWNKEEGKDYIYINGELMTTADAAGEFQFPKDNSNWFAVGCDAGPSGQLGWSGDVVLARIYDDPLTQEDVKKLWNKVYRQQQQASPTLVTDVEFYSGLAVTIGGKYQIFGNGFEDGDQLRFTSTVEGGKQFDLDGTVAEGSITVTIPEGFVSGQYRLILVRGEYVQDLGLGKLEVVETFPKPAEVIAHRGFWNTDGSAQNSLAALKKAQELDLYGSETDVWITTDGYLMINHDATINGITIQNSTYDQVKDQTLSNGEKISTLQDLLKATMESESRTKLIIEIKTHDSQEKNMRVAKATVDAVNEAGASSKIEYIAFDLEVCKELVRLAPDARVAYLSGGMAPDDVHALGITGLDYNIAEFNDHPEWISRAKELGMTVNVWTVNTMGDMAAMTNAGVEFITTDNPLDGLKIQKYYTDNQ